MCGLAGIVLAHSGDSPNEKILLAMRDAQLHRGPDEAGLYLGNGVGLGHRRLSIIDLDHGQQGMTLAHMIAHDGQEKVGTAATEAGDVLDPMVGFGGDHMESRLREGLAVGERRMG